MKKAILATLVMVASLLGVVPGTLGVASAEVEPYALDTWGVYNSIVGGTLTNSIDSEVMAIEQIGNTIYIGGKFTEVRQHKNSTPVEQSFLAAFNASTGAYIPSFAPDLGRPVYALQASPDGSKLFVGGEFGDVDGVANTKALVALDPATGEVDTSWRSQLKLNGRAVVFTLDFDENWLYAGGNFSAVGGAQGVPQIPVGRVVKLDLDNAAPDTSWTPQVSGGSVWGIAVAPNRSTVYLSGYFSSVNLVGGTQGFVGVDNTTGATILDGRLPHNNNNRKFYLDVVAVNGLVFVAGMEHITYVLNASDLSVKTLHSTGGTQNAGFGTGGDYQDLEVVGDRVYASCHCRGEHFADGDVFRFLIGQGGTWSRQDPIKFVAAYSAVDGSYIPSFQLDISGSSGSWAVHGSPDGCVWVGGDITRATRADGTNQARGGFSQHCEEGAAVDSERPTRPSALTINANGSTADLAWNPSSDNVGVTGYEIYRADTDGGVAQLVEVSSTVSFSDVGLADGTYWYYLRAVDAAGNQSWRTGYKSVTVGANVDTERPSVPNGVSVAVVGAGNDVSLSWNASSDNVGVTGYEIYRAPSENGDYVLVANASATTYQDVGLANGTFWYYLKAVDAAGNQSWRTGKRSVVVTGSVPDNERPSPPTGLGISAVGVNDVVLVWNASNDNVAVTSYEVYNNVTGLVVATSASPVVTVTGLDSATSYAFYVKARDAAGNQSWRSNLLNVTTS